MERVFKIAGATYNDNKEVIWLCRFYGEPFYVYPIEESKTRQKMWRDADDYFGKYILVSFQSASKRGVPLDKEPKGLQIFDNIKNIKLET